MTFAAACQNALGDHLQGLAMQETIIDVCDAVCREDQGVAVGDRHDGDLKARQCVANETPTQQQCLPRR